MLLGQEYTYSVEYNDFNAARDLTNFVLAGGHRKIAYIGGRGRRYSSRVLQESREYRTRKILFKNLKDDL